jgi:hypothetical protein
MKPTTSKTFFSTTISKEQNMGTGMAIVLILLFVTLATNNLVYIRLGAVVLLATMTIPTLFYPAAIVWFGLSNVLGAIMSRVILAVLFVVLVTPIGFLRSLFGYDPMRLRGWKKSSASVFKERHHTFSATDLEKPY